MPKFVCFHDAHPFWVKNQNRPKYSRVLSLPAALWMVVQNSKAEDSFAKAQNNSLRLYQNWSSFLFFVKLARLYPLQVRFPFDYFEHWLQPSAYLQFSPFQLFQQMLIFVEEWFFFTIILFIMPLAHDDNLADVMLSGFDSGDTD